ncbi:Hypothetical protein A7982_07058 [Minicystis rosea]|nr:Hypothetical protein A7982_07058 [Minicystis rosea]
MNKQTWAAAVVLVGIAAVYVLFFRKTDEDRILEKLGALSTAVREDEGENLALRAARIERAFPHLFTKEVDLHIPDVAEGRNARTDLIPLAAGAAADESKLELRFSRAHVEVDRPAQRGWVMADAILLGTGRDGTGHRESRPLALRFDMEDGEWKIADVALRSAESK